MIYNKGPTHSRTKGLWFDVGLRWYTTPKGGGRNTNQLWFDVGLRWYTTAPLTAHTGHSVVVWCRIKMIYNLLAWMVKSLRVVVWCRIKMIYNTLHRCSATTSVVVWCRIKMIYNRGLNLKSKVSVVVWCRIKMIYNMHGCPRTPQELWFDVGLRWYTTWLS